MASDITVLLPARNAEADLPRYFNCVARFSDSIVALDDGSTDTTPQLLESSTLVRILLRNPRRPTYAGWDDRANRSRLLRAATDLKPRWVLFLDADERIEHSDCEALLRFQQDGADPACAYGFQMHRMIGGDRCYDLNSLWNFRLFAFAPEQRLPARRLHFQPVPVQIPHDRRHPTDLRIQHFAGVDVARRQARFEKYSLADPTRRFQKSYDNLLKSVSALHLWQVRAASSVNVWAPLRR